MHTLFSRLNAPGVYVKIGSFDPTLFEGRVLIGYGVINEIRQFSVIF